MSDQQPCRRCSECVGQEHHFLEHAAEPEGDDDSMWFAGYVCKHCEAKADICDGCDGPIYPITGASQCPECDAGNG